MLAIHLLKRVQPDFSGSTGVIQTMYVQRLGDGVQATGQENGFNDDNLLSGS